jgi:hypothetical protein
VKAAGFAWAPGQKVFIAGCWTPEREDLLVDLCGEIEDHDRSLVELAEERAERFDGYAEKRADEAHRAHAAVAAIADGIPMGQPMTYAQYPSSRIGRSE